MSLKTMNEAKILVPITVEALLVNQDGNSRDYASLTPQFARLQYEVKGEKLVDEPFSLSPEKLEPGIHLHWGLPDALTHVVRKNEEAIVPNVPSRWLVVRMGGASDPAEDIKIVTKAWIIESDYIDTKKDDTHTQITFPRLNEAQRYGYLGKVYEYTQWKEELESGKHLKELKAIGPGDPLFAAYYPNCRSVFGFHDADVCQLPSGQLTYLIVGWYADPGKDPLYDETQTSWKEKIQHLGWGLSEETKLCPTQTLCHGMIVNVPWQGIAAEYDDGMPGSEVEVAVGNTYVEALSALLGSKFKSDENLARLLEIVQYDLISEWVHPDGISEVEGKIHERTFANSPGGILWVVRKKETMEENTNSSQKIKNLLNDLNAVQQSYEQVSSELISLQWKTYSHWYGYISEKSSLPEDGTAQAMSKNYEEEICRSGEIIEQYRQKKRDLEQQISRQGGILHNLLAQELPGYSLEYKARPRFWHVQNPVILLAGENIERSFKHGFDYRFDADSDTDGKLACRVTGQTVTGLRIPWQGQEVEVDKDDLMKWNPFPDGKLTEEVEALFFEAVFLSIDFAEVLAKLVSMKAKQGPQNADEMPKLVEDCKTIQLWHWNNYLHSNLEGLDRQVVGILPSKAGFEIWKAPWTPLVLQWKVQYYPASTEEPMQSILEPWKFKGLDFIWTGEKQLPQGFALDYCGSTLLTSSSATHLKNSMVKVIERLGKDNPVDPQLLENVQRLGNLRVLAQGLSGLHTEFIQKKESLQLAVIDPLINPPLAAKVNELIDGHNEYAPIRNGEFHPVRAGFMKVSRLRIIDTFGRIQDVQPKTDAPIVSEDLKTQNEKVAQMITLPPRLMQPARLIFTWLPALDAKNDANLNESPISGWILPNFLDQSIMVYNRSGQFLGALQRAFDADEFPETQWIEPPYQSNDGHDLLETGDPDLRALIEGLKENVDRGVDALAELLEYLDNILGGIDARNSLKEQNLAVFMGRPLALVRASLRLELQGLPVEHQAFEYPGKPATLGFEKIAFPVRLGDANKIQDGAVGYFIHQTDQASTYQKMYAVKGALIDEYSYIQVGHDLSLTCDPTAEKTVVTLLMDATKTVHVRSGILPEQQVRLPVVEYQSLLSNLNYHFMVEHLLSHPARFSLPLPAANDVQWHFLYREHPQGWQVIKDITNADGSGRYLSGSKQIYEGWLKLTSRENEIKN